MENFLNLYNECTLCPHKCRVDRKSNLGYCKADRRVKISAVSYYKGEEPCFNFDKGPGAIFFSNCTMRCVYCQNYAFSQFGNGSYLTTNDLVSKIMEVNEKASYLELVTPSHYIPSILEALEIAKKQGFNLPVVYNTSGYEDVEALRLLQGIVDIYLTDFRYSDNASSLKYSLVKNYFDIAKKAIYEMYSQVGNLLLDNGRAIKGIIIRYLILPNNINDHKIIFNWIYDNLGRYATISIMDQYVPVFKARKIPELGSYITKQKYEEVVKYALDKGFENLYLQRRLSDLKFIDSGELKYF
jgi:putative pyruvate formate lyase activating enzyme